MSGIRFRGVAIGEETIDDMSRIVAELVVNRRTGLISFVNPHTFHLLRHNASGTFKADLDRFDLIAADGVGVVAACRLLGLGRPPRFGFDLLAPSLFPRLAAAAVPVYLLGGKPGVAEEAARLLERKCEGLEVAGTHHGYVDGPEDLAATARCITDSGARVVCIGMGAPRQERWAVALSEVLPGRVFITDGGYFDQVLRPKPYFPRWSHRLGLNWLVRLLREPRRLWRRCLLETSGFVLDTSWWAVSGGLRDDARAAPIQWREEAMATAERDDLGR